MTGYTKLFGSIIGSTIWREPDHVRLVWITMLALKDRNQKVEASVPGLADFAKVSVENCRKALKVLSSPDPDSRSKEYEGRRIREVDGGWVILNGEKYREKMNQDERREANRLYQKRFRERQKQLRSGAPLAGELAHKRAFEAGEVDADGAPIPPQDQPPNPQTPPG
jgi:hypothetical protein